MLSPPAMHEISSAFFLFVAFLSLTLVRSSEQNSFHRHRYLRTTQFVVCCRLETCSNYACSLHLPQLQCEANRSRLSPREQAFVRVLDIARKVFLSIQQQRPPQKRVPPIQPFIQRSFISITLKQPSSNSWWPLSVPSSCGKQWIRRSDVPIVRIKASVGLRFIPMNNRSTGCSSITTQPYQVMNHWSIVCVLSINNTFHLVHHRREMPCSNRCTTLFLLGLVSSGGVYWFSHFLCE